LYTFLASPHMIHARSIESLPPSFLNPSKPKVKLQYI
jgi:hypothetical protein